MRIMETQEYRRGYSDRVRFGEHGHGESEHNADYWEGFCDACRDVERKDYWTTPRDFDDI